MQTITKLHGLLCASSIHMLHEGVIKKTDEQQQVFSDLTSQFPPDTITDSSRLDFFSLPPLPCPTSHHVSHIFCGIPGFKGQRGESKWLCVDTSLTLIQVSAIGQPSPASIKGKETMR